MVLIAMPVGLDGIPTDCFVLVASGSTSLDQGTCALALLMRFAPARDDKGSPLPSTYRAKLIWVLEDDRPLTSAEFQAEITTANRRITGCNVTGRGPYMTIWRQPVCSDATIFFAGPNARVSMPSRAILAIRIDAGDGLASQADWPKGKVIARDFTSFRINKNGDAVDCQPEADGDVFSNNFHSRNPCGHYLSLIPFAWPDKKDSPRGGVYELRVIIPDQ